jgi:hypothetical protein
MSREIRATAYAETKWLFGILFLLTPSGLAFIWATALSRNASSASASWFLYEVSRLIAYIGIATAAALTLGMAIRRGASGLFLALMIVSTGSAALLLWYTAHIFRSPW